jgi:hypothetical protein
MDYLILIGSIMLLCGFGYALGFFVSILWPEDHFLAIAFVIAVTGMILMFIPLFQLVA